MTVHRASAVLRDRRGRELASRYHYWTGDVAGQREAAEQARAALGALDDERVDTVLVTIEGADGGKLGFTEYAEDLRAGRFVSANQSTLMLDDERLSDEERAAISASAQAEQERIKKEALDAMPKARELLAEREAVSRPADALEEFFNSMPGGRRSVVLDEAPLTKEEQDDLIEGARTIFSSALDASGRAKSWQVRGADVVQNILDAKRQMEELLGAACDEVLMGDKAYDALVEHLRVQGGLPSGANPKYYAGPVTVGGVRVHRSGSDDDRVQTVRRPRPSSFQAHSIFFDGFDSKPGPPVYWDRNKGIFTLDP